MQPVQHRWPGANLFQRLGHDRPGGFDRTPACEDGELTEQCPLIISQQVIAVADGVAQGALTDGQIACAIDEHLEPIAQAGDECLRRQDARARGRQLDRERQSVQAHADLGNRGRILLGHLETRLGGSSTLDEQLDS